MKGRHGVVFEEADILLRREVAEEAGREAREGFISWAEDGNALGLVCERLEHDIYFVGLEQGD